MAKELKLPPYPAQAQPGEYIWVDWWRQLQQFMRDILKELDNMQYVSKANEMFGSSVTVRIVDEPDRSGALGDGVLVMSQGICVFSFTGTADITTDVGLAPNPVSTSWEMLLARASALPQPFIGGVGCFVEVVSGGISPTAETRWRGTGRVYGTGSRIEIQADVPPLMRSQMMIITVNGSFPITGV